MNNIILIIAGFFFTILSTSAQVIYNEDFSKGLDWLIKKEADLTIDKNGGTYNWNKKTSSWYASWKPVDFLQGNNYRISFRMNHVSGADNYGAGLIFGLQDVSNFYCLQITANGYYALYNIYGGNWSALIDWTPSSAIKKGNNVWNEIALEKKDGNWQVIINSQPQKTTPVKPFYSSNTGFMVNEVQEIKFDDLKAELTGAGQEASIMNSLFEETFSDNSHHWDLEPTATNTRKIEDGVLKFSRIANDGNSYTTNPANIQLAGDFSVAVDVKHESGTKNFGYGILFGAEDGNNTCAFLITANGYFMFYIRYHGNGVNKISPWAYSAWINKGNDMNRLMVKKAGGSFELYINNHHVQTIGAEKLPGNNIGFSIENDQEVWFDNLSVNVSHSLSSRNVLLEEYFNTGGTVNPFRKNSCDATNEFYSAGIGSNSKYYVDIYQPTDFTCIYDLPALDLKRDYKVSIDMEISSDTSGGGLVWGYKDEDNFYALFIVSQSYQVVKVSGGNLIAIGGDNVDRVATNREQIALLLGWEKNPFVHKEINRGAFAKNNLRLEVRNGNLNVIINGNKMSSVEIGTAYPASIGFIAANPGVITFDNFRVEQ